MGRHAGTTILVVEDDPTIAALVQTCLQDEGYRVVIALHFAQAVDALAHTRFALVLADTLSATQAVRGADRWTLLEQVRALAGYTPVVIFTAHRAQEYADFRARGFHDLLLKPFDLDELVATVQRSLGCARGESLPPGRPV